MSTTHSPAAVLDRLRQPEHTGENRCTPCDGEIQFDQETVESCCRSKEVVAATCQECGTRLMEAEYEGDSAPPAG